MVKTNYFNKFRKGKAKPKKAVRPLPKKGGMTFAKRVNQLISRQIENKRTVTYASYLPVYKNNAFANTKQWYLEKDWNAKLFTLSQGTTQGTRTGNQIKLKRWVIRGQITPKDNNAPNSENFTTIPNSYNGYVDLYFGRLMDNNELSSTLTGLLQNGAAAATPQGTQSQIF